LKPRTGDGVIRPVTFVQVVERSKAKHGEADLEEIKVRRNVEKAEVRADGR
jgi:hypothetical protein